MVTVMGLQVRKRTKGKKSWWNGSYSRKGAGASGSVKLSDNVTWNTGDLLNSKTKQRVTVNMGNGVRWVWYDKKKKPTKRRSTTSDDYTPSTKPWNESDTKWVSIIGVAIVLSTIAFGFFGFFGSIIIGWMAMVYKVNWHDY